MDKKEFRRISVCRSFNKTLKTNDYGQAEEQFQDVKAVAKIALWVTTNNQEKEMELNVTMSQDITVSFLKRVRHL